MTLSEPGWRGFAHYLTVESRANGVFVGRCMPGRGERAFGGHLVAHALVVAGSQASDGHVPLSLHTHFLAAVDSREEVEYRAAALRQGRSFEHWQIDAFQSGTQVMSSVVALHRPEPSPEHQVVPLEDVDPTSLPRVAASPHKGANNEIRAGLELRRGRHWQPGDPSPVPYQHMWIRCVEDLPSTHLLDWAVLLWCSDLEMTGTADLPHREGVAHRVAASLDHVVYFHEPIDPTDWLLFEQVSPSLHGGRALTTGRIFDRTGRLSLSVSQQSLLRLTPEVFPPVW